MSYFFKKIFFLIILVAIGTVGKAAKEENSAVEIIVTANPVLPFKNLLAGNPGFENGLKGWALDKKAIKNKSIEATEIDDKKVLYIKSSKGVVGRTVKVEKPFEAGEKYILSCIIKADKKVSQRAGLCSGCGATFSFFSKEWKKAVTVCARSANTKGKWIKIVSKPIKCPEWATLYRLHMGLNYSSGAGYIDDVILAKAYTTLRIEVKSSVNLRQIIVDDESGKNVFDSDLLDDGQKTFTKSIKLISAYQYQIKVLDVSGNVYIKNYPEKSE